MVRMFPEQWIAWASHSYDVIDVRVADGGSLSASTCADAWHTEELFAILLPLVSIATPRRGGTWTRQPWTFKHWLRQTIWAANAITDQVPRMRSTWTRRSMRHQLDELNRAMPKPRV